MREILFRGKRKDNGEWGYGDLIHNDNGFNDQVFIAKLIIGENEDKHQFDDDEILLGWSPYNVIPSTIGQYTGLTDKNGRKIFEGDILQCNNNPIDLVKVVYGNFGVVDIETETVVDNVIGWHYEVIPTDELSKVEPFCLPMPLTEFYINRCTMVVIGNIYDNPELLEGS